MNDMSACGGYMLTGTKVLDNSRPAFMPPLDKEKAKNWARSQIRGRQPKRSRDN